MVGSFQAAKVNQKIKEEKMNIDIVDRMKQIEIQENEIERRSKELGKGSSKVYFDFEYFIFPYLVLK